MVYRVNAKPDEPAPVRRALEPDDARFDIAARIVVMVAASDAQLAHELDVTPERLLLAALWDPAVLRLFAHEPQSARDELLVAMAEFTHVGDAFERPCRRTAEVLVRAERRAAEAGRYLLTRGDLLHGIAATAGPAGRILRRARLWLEPLDATVDNLLPAPHPSPETATELAVVLLREPTAIPATIDVVSLLERVFHLAGPDAYWKACALHAVGHVRIFGGAALVARDLAELAAVEARQRHLPLVVRVV